MNEVDELRRRRIRHQITALYRRYGLALGQPWEPAPALMAAVQRDWNAIPGTDEEKDSVLSDMCAELVR